MEINSIKSGKDSQHKDEPFKKYNSAVIWFDIHDISNKGEDKTYLCKNTCDNTNGQTKQTQVPNQNPTLTGNRNNMKNEEISQGNISVNQIFEDIHPLNNVIRRKEETVLDYTVRILRR